MKIKLCYRKELKKEERRIEMLMEQERIMAAKKYEKAVEADRLKKKLQATDIVQQIKKNEMAREFEAAKTAEVGKMIEQSLRLSKKKLMFIQEARVHKEASIEAQRVEVKDLKEKLIKQAEMRREFLQINAQLKDMKQTDKELARIEVLQVNMYNNKVVFHN